MNVCNLHFARQRNVPGDDNDDDCDDYCIQFNMHVYMCIFAATTMKKLFIYKNHIGIKNYNAHDRE